MSTWRQDQAGGSGRTRAGSAADLPTTQRKLVEIREKIAEVASKAADADLARVLGALERYESQAEMQARAEAAWDPTAMGRAKDAAHHAFRVSAGAARERVTVEAAAASWLDEINRINIAMRSAQAQIRRERETSAALLAEIDRLRVEAGASRARADAAVTSFRAAQIDLARALGLPVGNGAASAVEPLGAPVADQAVEPAVEPVGAPAVEPAAPLEIAALASADARPPGEAATAEAAPEPAEPDLPAHLPPHPPRPDAIDLDAQPRQALLGLLGGDEDARDRLAVRLAGDDVDATLVWQTWLRGLVDACAAVCIDEGYLDFPLEHPFWGMFTVGEARAIGKALAALGFRHDGRGWFLEDRVPGSHDLVAATGSAGLLAVRVRRWPVGDEIGELYRDVRVATDLLLAERAQFLTLGEVVSLLGWRAEPLADLWNEWPKARTMLLAPES
jgi:hypothetical protein